MGDITIKLRAASDDAIDEITSLCDSLRDASRECGKLRSEVDRLNSELANLQAERNELKALTLAQAGATIDNGDGTVTVMLPVTHPAGLDVVEVRSRKIGDVFAYWKGESTADADDDDHANVWLILRPAPKPPEPVTWEAPLADGEWMATHHKVESGDFCLGFGGCIGKIRGLDRPTKLGKYVFKDGVGTLIQEAGNE